MPGRKKFAGPDALLSGPAAFEPQERLCFAYGSNLDEAMMQRRCPGAVAVATFILPGYRLCFRDYADIESFDGAQTPGVIYNITPDGERLLDYCEGVTADGRGLYRKETFDYRHPVAGHIAPVLFYAMNEGRTFPPDEGYYRLIQRAYERWGFPLHPLEDALRRAQNTSV